jgi:hypothetical protein
VSLHFFLHLRVRQRGKSGGAPDYISQQYWDREIRNHAPNRQLTIDDEQEALNANSDDMGEAAGRDRSPALEGASALLYPRFPVQ